MIIKEGLVLRLGFLCFEILKLVDSPFSGGRSVTRGGGVVAEGIAKKRGQNVFKLAHQDFYVISQVAYVSRVR